MFYLDKDKSEIRAWIKNSTAPIYNRITEIETILKSDELPDATKKYLQREINEQIFALSNEFQSQFDTLRANSEKLKATFQSQIEALIAENSALRSELDELKRKPANVSDFQSENSALKRDIDELKLGGGDIKKFYLKANDEVFIPCDRKQISAQITKALNVDDIKKFLVDNDSEISKKFQRLINTHCNALKNFLNKLKLNDLDDDELSETVTVKYFKLFHQIIFDNIIVAVKRGLNDSDDFYRAFLPKINAYLEQCGFYTVNSISGIKAEDTDYENMSPQIIETPDKNLDKIIKDIERLPYRINYLDEFGEKNFFQYNGVMILYKEV